MKNRILFLLVVILQLFAQSATAGVFNYTSKLQGSALAMNAVFETVDDQYLYMTGTLTGPAWHNSNKNKIVDNFLHLKYSGAANVHYNANWSIQVACQIERWDEHGVLLPIESSVLLIDYKPGAGTKYTDISTYRNLNKGGNRVRITVTGLSLSPGLTAMPSDVLLENVINVERTRLMAQTAPILNSPIGGVLGACPGAGADNIDFSWNYLDGAEEYDFEWVFISDYVLPATAPAPDYAGGSRITATNQYCSISATFDNGKIYYRVRGLGKDFATGTKRLEGVWTSWAGPVQVCNPEKRNWTYNAVYAEEGKRKEVMTYFDGSGRTRQSVTLSNTEGVGLVAENIYDYEGRPAIQTLPAPSKNFRGNLKFYQRFNLNTAGIPYSKKDFDTDAQSVCETPTVPTPGMNSSAANGDGASLYYSENNLLVNPGAASVIPDNGFNVLIPDADDYPFTQTVYSNDGSVKLQSGVGPTHAIKSGHETQYFNATAGQAKLDRLFGNEVGYAEHYREKVVLDPNGQISVSYENLSGQVIATAMRGFGPKNLMELGPAAAEEPYTAPELTQEQFTNQYDAASESYVSLSNFWVSETTTPYNFSYTITPQVFYTICNKQYNCKYLLKITITDDCGVSITEEVGSVISAPSTTPVLNNIHHIDAANFTNTAFQAAFSVKFPHLGVYRIEKTLSLDPNALQTALADFEAALRQMNDSCITPLSSLEALYGAGVDMTECLTCDENCDYEASQIDWTLYNASNPYVWDDTHSFGSAADYIVYCKSLCIPEIPRRSCDGLLDALKADMSPGGQYFDATLSNFSDPGSFSNPFHSLTAPQNYFFDALYAMEAANLSNPAKDFTNEWNNYNTAHGCAPFPAYSSNWHADLTNNWDPCWEDFLIKYHPEYCRWERCKKLTGSYDFEVDLLNANYDQATTTKPSTNAPYLVLGSTPVGISVLNTDPYFNTINPADFTFMAAQIGTCSYCHSHYQAYPSAAAQNYNQNTSMWDWATVAPIDISLLSNSPLFPEIRWRNFQKLYLATKAEYVKNIPCSALPDTDYPPDNTAEVPNTSIPVVFGGSTWHTILVGGLTINDPEPLNNIQNIINAINPPSVANNYSSQLIICNYGAPTATMPIYPSGNGADPVVPNGGTPCPAGILKCSSFQAPTPALNNSYVFYVRISQIPTNYPYDNTPVTWSNTNCYIRISNPVILPNIYLTSSVSDVTNYLNLIKQAINNYNSAPYDFTCSIYPPSSSGAPYRYEIIAPSELGVISNPGNLKWSIERIEPTLLNIPPVVTYYCGPSHSDFITTPPICDTLSYEPHCLCIQLLQGAEFYNARDINGTYIINHTQYPTVEDFLAANLSDGSLVVTPANIQYWMRNCKKNNNTSPLNLDGNGNITTRTAINNNLNTIPEKLNCKEPCQQQGMEEADFYASQAFEALIQQLLQEFVIEYKKACLNATALTETFQVEYYEKEYHYTLYYYDQAGNLVRTVPPSAVRRIPSATLYAGIVNQVHYARLHAADPVPPPLIFPGHSRVVQNNTTIANLMVTNYKYNTLNQLVQQETPDGGLTKFWYNSIGQLRFSQNAKQKQPTTPNPNGLYSYTIYDPQGRIIEVGENYRDITFGSGQNTLDAPFYAGVNTPNFPIGTGKQVTKTYYDAALNGLPFGQEFLRKRVSSTTYEDVEDNSDLTFNSATHFSYDPHGNVNLLVQDFRDLAVNNNRFKKIYYKYDLISGNVNEVQYQPGQFDQYYHRYRYDANNRITHAHTSNDRIHWQQDARYFYFLHGPLARVEIGEEKVQGLDYAYNLQGWIKAVNSNTLSANFDSGKDGYAGAYFVGQNDIHKNTARDVFGYSLEYYHGDYKSIAINPMTTRNWSADLTGSISLPGTTPYTATPDLFNGNIKAMATAMYQPAVGSGPGMFPTEIPTMARFFKYDQLNRIKEAQAYTFAATDPALNTVAPHAVPTTSDYYEAFRYDANGNILHALRKGYAAAPSGADMDDMFYLYPDLTKNNQLGDIMDAVPPGNYSEDIDDQGNTANYTYDAIGNLTKDEAENIVNIDWSVYGKILKIYKAGGLDNIEFKYDPFGNRIQKIVKPKTRSGEKTQEYWTNTYYARDAQGNIMAIYDRKMSVDVVANSVNDRLFLQETNIYGSSRLGLETQADRVPLTPLLSYNFGGYNADGTIINSGLINPSIALPGARFDHALGNKSYELSNHLGNVNVVISDRKLSVGNGGGAHVYYLADVRSGGDYYAFGAEMVGRSFAGSYRYGFNGKENDDEVKGIEGSQQDYGMRIYDSRIGKFLSVDPLAPDYPWNSTYAFAENDVIRCTDLDGAEKKINIYAFNDQTKGYTLLKTMNWGAMHNQRSGPLGYGDYNMYYTSKGVYVGSFYAAASPLRFIVEGTKDVEDWSIFKPGAENGPGPLGGTKGFHNGGKQLIGQTLLTIATMGIGTAISGLNASWKIYAAANFSYETGSKLITAGGDITKVDWFDVILSTATKTLTRNQSQLIKDIGDQFKNAASATFDANVDKGFQAAFYNKDGMSVTIDITASQLKDMLGLYAKSFGEDAPSEQAVKLLMDHLKAQFKDKVDKINLKGE